MIDDLRAAIEALLKNPKYRHNHDYFGTSGECCNMVDRLRAVLADHPAAPARQTAASLPAFRASRGMPSPSLSSTMSSTAATAGARCVGPLADHPATPDDLRAVIEALADSWDGPRLDGSQDWHARELRAALSGTEGEA